MRGVKGSLNPAGNFADGDHFGEVYHFLDGEGAF